MKVTIVMGGYEFGMEVGPQEPILEMKRRIQNLLGVPMASQSLSVFGWELIDGLDMEDYPIISDATKIDLSIQSTHPLDHHHHQQQQPSNSTNKFHITVKFSARKINMEVDATDTVRSLKEKIHIIDGTPIKRMALFFSGNELEEEHQSLSQCGIREFSQVIVYLKTMSRAMADPPSRKISFLVQTSSSLLNAASIPVEMSDLTTVNDLIQSLITRKLLPQDDYIFIHKQRIMRESCSLRWHGVENGECLYVFKGTVSSG
ncbi:PREDICTED: polyubiquitin [Ipomoea nil]|uniref:polyubiquitin n=1 Tax=Ipomoea nil TaxID=35883 RepID=UPI0009016735|nr:PREDICTED: polyubiquitin [Ipomoea nil]